MRTHLTDTDTPQTDPGFQTAEIARDAMRRATADAHARVEALLGLGSPNVSWAEYHTALAALTSVFGVVATWLAGTRLSQLAPARCERLSVHVVRLHADMAYVRAQSPDVAPRPLAVVSDPPVDWSEIQGFGMLYVIEGSTLGGQYVARNIAQRFGLDAQHGLAFLQGDSSGTGARWRAFRADLAQHVVTDAQAALAVSGALWTFEALMRTWVQLGAQAGSAQ